MAFLQHEKETSVQALLDLIRSDGLDAEARLPGESVLCQRLGLSRHLVRLGLEQLQTEGIISRRGRSGSYVQRVPDDTPVARPAGHSTVSLMLAGQVESAEIEALQMHALQRGFLLHLYFAQHHGHRADEERAYLEQVAMNGYAGAVLHPTPRGPSNDPLFRRLAGQLRLAHVDYHSTEMPEQSFFLPDYTTAGLMAGTQLLARGCRRLVLASALPTPHHVTRLLAQGLARASEVAGIDAPWVLGDCFAGTGSMTAYRQDWQTASTDTGYVLYGNDAASIAASHRLPYRRAVRVQETERADAIAPWLPTLNFDRTARLRDALDHIMTGSHALRHRLYAPTYRAGAPAR